jgi:Mitochondrial carrier protein
MTNESENINMNKYISCIGCLSLLQYTAEHPMNLILTKKQTINIDLSMRRYFSYIVKNYHPSYFARGMYISVGGYSLGQMVHLYLIEYYKINPFFANENQNIMFAGMVSELASNIVYYPFCLLSTMQITYKKKYNSCILSKRLYNKRGVGSFYNGFGLYAASGAAWSGLWWLMYENSKYYSKQYITDYEMAINGCCSLGSTITTTALFNPFSIVVTKMQANKNANYSNIIRSIYNKHGIKGFWRASMLNVSAYICTDLLFALTYETSRNYALK